MFPAPRSCLFFFLPRGLGDPWLGHFLGHARQYCFVYFLLRFLLLHAPSIAPAASQYCPVQHTPFPAGPCSATAAIRGSARFGACAPPCSLPLEAIS